MSHTARLVLEDGAVFEGQLFGYSGAVAGEVVFTTGMVGYPETLTDPSYRGQIVVFTYPLIGNYGVPAYGTDPHGLPRGFESACIQAAGVVVAEASSFHQHRLSTRSLHQWLESEQIPGISGIDTRALTKRLREQGTMLGRIEAGGVTVPFRDPNGADLVAEVTTTGAIQYDCGTAGAPTILLVDCGCKTNIIRSLLRRGVNVIRVRHDDYFLNREFDGLLISNGPGDPKRCTATVRNIERALALGKPILGICLGLQLLALAVGADTYKLKFGHRSQNQPCLEFPDGDCSSEPRRCVITTQNHGYAVREQTLPRDWRLWFRNANDGTVEGIRHVSKPFAAVQFHPEASPGPVDTAGVFDEFIAQVTRTRKALVSS